MDGPIAAGPFRKDMSKIFEALQGIKSEVAELLPTLVEAGGPERPLPGPVISMLDFASVPSSEPAAGYAEPAIRRMPVVVSANAPLLPFEDPRWPAAEQYRILRTKLNHDPKQPRVIVVSSAISGDGKSITAINLAGVLSLKAESKVLLIDADFRRPGINFLLGLPKSPGLGEVITGECSFEDAVIQAEQYPNLNILANGETKVNPSELLDSQRWHTLCQHLRGSYQYVIIDSPPIASVADCELLQMAADGTILVVRPEHTKRTIFFKAQKSIPADKFLGVVINCVDRWFLNKFDSYSYTNYRSAALGSGTKA
jgi:capsular exopolysaccharide synthesis family protein